MAHDQPTELFMPPNMLKAKVGGGLGGIDMAALKRADAALETLSVEYAGWLDQDVKALVAAHAHFAGHPTAESRAALLRAAHDIKGQAATFNFPLVARVAASLSRLLGEIAPGEELPQGLTDAHVQAVQVIHRENIQDTSNPMAQMLCAELDSKVSKVLPRT
jgi:HPt (histidine-containing phosphotransfer) domain-containing protein